MTGLLVTFEGQDGSGKSTLLQLAAARLKQEDIPVVIVPEFSSGPLGTFLKNSLRQNKFLRFNKGVPSAITETMAVVADLYWQDELEIRPALRQDCVVLKERHIDSVLACQIPKIVDDYPSYGAEMLFRWLVCICSRLAKPDLTCFLDVESRLLAERITARGEQVAADDFRVFVNRQVIYDRLAAENQHRWVRVLNSGDTADAVQIIIRQINRHLG